MKKAQSLLTGLFSLDAQDAKKEKWVLVAVGRQLFVVIVFRFFHRVGFA